MMVSCFKRRIAPSRQRSRGQSLVEFGLVFPVFALLVAGMIDFGLGLYSNMTVINAAREGARLGVTSLTATAGQDDPAIIVSRVNALTQGLDQAGLTVNVSCVQADLSTACANSPDGYPAWASGDGVIVTVDYTYKLIWPLALGTTLPMSSSVTMRIE